MKTRRRDPHKARPAKLLWHVAINIALAIGFIVPLSLALLGQLHGGLTRLAPPGWTWDFVFPVAFLATICAGLVAAAIFEFFTVEEIPTAWRDAKEADRKKVPWRAVSLTAYALAFLLLNPVAVHTGLEKAWVFSGQIAAPIVIGVDPEQDARDRHVRNLARFEEEPWTDIHHARQTQIRINSYLEPAEKVPQDGEWGDLTDLGLQLAQTRAQDAVEAIDGRMALRAADAAGANDGPPWWLDAAMWLGSIIWSLVSSFGRLTYHGARDAARRKADNDNEPGVDRSAKPIVKNVDGVTYIIAKVWDGVGPKPDLPHPRLHWALRKGKEVYVLNVPKRRFGAEIDALNAAAGLKTAKAA